MSGLGLGPAAPLAHNIRPTAHIAFIMHTHFLAGGTDVPFSPPLDFVTMVVQPLLRTMGADVKLLQPEAGAKKSSPGYPR